MALTNMKPKLPNPLDGDRAAIEYDNQMEEIASNARWEVYYCGRKDAQNFKSKGVFRGYNYSDADDRRMYSLGWQSVRKES